MTLIIFYKDGRITAEPCHSVKICEDYFFRNGVLVDMSDMQKIIVDGVEVWEANT